MEIYNYVICLIGYDRNRYERVFIESQYDKSSLWGEFFAQRLGAKHICILTNEVFRREGLLYEKYMDFFIFKFKRGELLSDLLDKLFDGYMKIGERERDLQFHHERIKSNSGCSKCFGGIDTSL